MISSTQDYVGHQSGRRPQGQGGVDQGLVGHQECQLFRERTSQNSILFGLHSNRYSKRNIFLLTKKILYRYCTKYIL